MGIIQTGKEIAQLAQQLGSIEIQQKVIELQSLVRATQEEVQKLRQENAELTNVEKIDRDMFLANNAYFRANAPVTRRGPFCKRCWDVTHKQVSLETQTNGSHFCMECKNTFSTDQSRAETQRIYDEEGKKSDAWGDGIC